jgi:hypothetical protein
MFSRILGPAVFSKFKMQMRPGGLPGRSNVSNQTTGSEFLVQDRLDEGQMAVEAYPVIPVPDNDVVPINRLRSGLDHLPVGGGKNFGPLRRGQIQPLVNSGTAGNRVDPGAEGAGKDEIPQGKAESPVKKKNPLRGAEIIPWKKEEGPARSFSPQINLFPAPVRTGGGHEPFKVGIRFLGDKDPRYGGKQHLPRQRGMRQTVDAGKGGIGNIAAGGDGEEILPFGGTVAINGKNLRRIPFHPPGPAEEAPPGILHILLILGKTQIPVIQPEDKGQGLPEAEILPGSPRGASGVLG